MSSRLWPMSKPYDVSRMVDETVSRFGGLHIAVNNAGTLTKPVRFHEMAYEEWNQVIAVNLTGVFCACKRK